MIPEPIAPPKPSNQKTEGKKKQPLPKQSVAFSNEIELLTSVNQAQQIPQQRRAIDYEPPTSFLQTMERPVKQQNAKGNVLADLWTY
jgi:hypothetical protein